MAKEFPPMKCQVPDKDRIICKDCIYRDRTTIKIDKTVYPVGITKGTCEMFVYPDSKPGAVLFQNADCEFYEEE